MSGARKTRRGTPMPADDLVSLYEVFDETRALFHRLAAVAEELHGHGKRSGGRRGILESLARKGPQTVPQLARARPVSRQHVQVLVNELTDAALVESIDNPAHRRSRLIRLTDPGRNALTEMYRREARLMRAMPRENLSEEHLRTAADVLRRVRKQLENSTWRENQEAS